MPNIDILLLYWKPCQTLGCVSLVPLLAGLQQNSRHCAPLHERGRRLLVPRLHSGAADDAPVLQQAARGSPSGPGISADDALILQQAARGSPSGPGIAADDAPILQQAARGSPKWTRYSSR